MGNFIMTEEEKTEEKQEEPKEEQKPVSALEEVRKERIELEKLRDEIKEERERIEAIKTEEILSGKSETPSPEKKKEVSPEEYAKSAMQGIPINEG